MFAVTGDETGLCKDVCVEGEGTALSWGGGQSREHGVDRMCWLDDAVQDRGVVVALRSGSLQHWSPSHAHSSAGGGGAGATPARCVGSFEGRAAGLQALSASGRASESPSLVLCNEEGCVQLMDLAPAKKHKELSFSTVAEWGVGGPVHQMRLEPTEGVITVGGNEKDLSLWSLETQQSLFKAKNVAHDKLELRVPIWITDMQFTSAPGGGRFGIVTGTGHGHVRLYDTAARRAPVHSIDVGEFPVSAIELSPDKQTLFVGDTTGGMNSYDLRTWRHLGRFQGPAGSVRALSCHPSLPYVSCVGLDRFLHVFHQSTRKLAHKVYLKQRLTAVLFSEQIPAPAADSEGSDASDGEAYSELDGSDSEAEELGSGEDASESGEASDDMLGNGEELGGYGKMKIVNAPAAKRLKRR